MSEPALTTSQCQASVREQGRWPRHHQCRRSSTVERDGKLYCAQHDPVKRTERREAAAAKYSAGGNYRQARSDVLRALQQADPNQLPPNVMDALARFLRSAQECWDAGIEIWKL